MTKPPTNHHDRIRALAESGLVRLPTRPLDLDTIVVVRPRDPDGRSLRAVLEERSGGR